MGDDNGDMCFDNNDDVGAPSIDDMCVDDPVSAEDPVSSEHIRKSTLLGLDSRKRRRLKESSSCVPRSAPIQRERALNDHSEWDLEEDNEVGPVWKLAQRKTRCSD